MQILYTHDHEKDETYMEWLARKREKEGFVLSVSDISKRLYVSNTWIFSMFHEDLEYIKVSNRLFYSQSLIEDWLSKNCQFTMQTRTLNLLDFCTAEALLAAEKQCGEQHGIFTEMNIDGQPKHKRMPGHMPKRLLQVLHLPIYSMNYFHRPQTKPVSIPPFPFLDKKLLSPKMAGQDGCVGERKHREQLYRDAFMMGWLKITCGRQKTLWIPPRQKEPFIPWTIPASVEKIGSLSLPPLTADYFLSETEEIPLVSLLDHTIQRRSHNVG